MIIRVISKNSDIMKEKIIKTDKATLLVVELPEGGKRIAGIACDITGHFILWDDGGSYHDDNRPHGQFRIDDNPRNKWQLLGRLPDITEGDLYTNGFRGNNLVDELHSLLQANEVWFENPLGEEHPPKCDCTGSCTEEEIHGCLGDFVLWQEAQSKVWYKERTFLFIKVE